MANLAGYVGRLSNKNVISGIGTRPPGVSPLAGVEVDIYVTGTTTRIKSPATTDGGGRWSFTGLATGNYDVAFRGGGAKSPPDPNHCWLLNVKVVESVGAGGEIEEIIFADFTAITLTVTEETAITGLKPSVDVNKAEKSYAKFVLTNLTTTQGTLATIRVFYKLSGESTSDYKILGTYDNGGESSATFHLAILLRDKPTTFNFSVDFLNPAGKQAMSGGSPITKTSTVAFTGVTSIDIPICALDVMITNCDDPDGGPPPDPPDLDGDAAELSWADPRLIKYTDWGTPTRYKKADGSSISLTWATAQQITGFIVYVFISSDGELPTEEFPGGNTGNHGTWYFVAKVEKPKATVRLPASSDVGFWVGFFDETTDLTIGGLVTEWLKV
jgi:hypothetical protein